MQNEEFFVGDDEGSSGSDLELVIERAKEEKKVEEAEAQSIFDYDIESFADRPWNKPGADITDYFNYGFNETTWKEYCSMQRRKNEFAAGSDWDGKYGGVRRGFSEIKREDGRGRRGEWRGERWEWKKDGREERLRRQGDRDEGKRVFRERR